VYGRNATHLLTNQEISDLHVTSGYAASRESVWKVNREKPQ
jgi:hypothetical protein